MGVINVRGDALARLSQHLRKAAEDILDDAADLLTAFVDVQSDWSDESYIEVRQRVESAMSELSTFARQLWAQSEWVSALAARVEMLGSGGGQGPSPSQTKLGGGTTSPVPLAPFERASALPVLGRLGSGKLCLLDTKGFHLRDFDWSSNAPDEELRKPHHNRLPDDYQDLLRMSRQALVCVEQKRPIPEELRECHSVMFEREPVVLDRRSDGGMDIIDGRHRLFWALKMGATIPVVFRDKS